MELKLETPGGHLEWHGYLVFWCEFGASFTCSIEDLTDTVEREGEYDLLSSFLVPYYSNKRMDEVAEQIWLQYIPEALTDPTKRIASELAKRMGLTIQYHPVYEHRGVDSILFYNPSLSTTPPKRFSGRLIKAAPSMILIIFPSDSLIEAASFDIMIQAK